MYFHTLSLPVALPICSLGLLFLLLLALRCLALTSTLFLLLILFLRLHLLLRLLWLLCLWLLSGLLGAVHLEVTGDGSKPRHWGVVTRSLRLICTHAELREDRVEIVVQLGLLRRLLAWLGLLALGFAHGASCWVRWASGGSSEERRGGKECVST